MAKVKVKILKEFRDKDRFTVVYPVGETFEFEAKRAQTLADRGLVELLGKKRRETAEVKENDVETQPETAEVKENE